MTRSFTPSPFLSLCRTIHVHPSPSVPVIVGGLLARGDGRGSLSLSPILVTIIHTIVLVIIIALVIIEDPRCRPSYRRGRREGGAAVTPVIGLSTTPTAPPPIFIPIPTRTSNSNVICRYVARYIRRRTVFE